MSIRKIKIENVRGISSRSIPLDIHPNKVTFFVAPNGFGKTSIARAFAALKRGKVEICDEDRHKGIASAQPLIEITDSNGVTYCANSTSNSISETFSICVINSQVRPKAISRNFGGHMNASSSLVVDPIVLYGTIPQKKELQYSFSDMKKHFGPVATKLLLKLTTFSKDPAFLRCLNNSKSEIKKMEQTRLARKISDCLERIESIQGTKETIVLSDVGASEILSLPSIHAIDLVFSPWLGSCSANEKIVNIMQLYYVFSDNAASFSDIVSYGNFLREQAEIKEILSCLNCTWKDIKPVKRGNQFVIEFPKANQISNGERDILCFVGKLFEAKSKLRKDKSILIIDEIFDYLDDANLIAAQYFLTKLMEQFKNAGKELYIILLTHLDPIYFNTYSFSSKNVVYLDPVGTITNKYNVNNFLKARPKCKGENRPRYDRISTHFFHYSPDSIDEHEYLAGIGVTKELHTSSSFQHVAFEELDKYIDGTDYDPILVCCGVRLRIEKNAYEMLPPEKQAEFLCKNKTTDKLAFAKDNGANIPEIYFLLSIIYNEAMHLDEQCKKLSPISCKLKNKVIHKMISEL